MNFLVSNSIPDFFSEILSLNDVYPSHPVKSTPTDIISPDYGNRQLTFTTFGTWKIATFPEFLKHK